MTSTPGVEASSTPVGWQPVPRSRHAALPGTATPVGWAGLPDRMSRMTDELGISSGPSEPTMPASEATVSTEPEATSGHHDGGDGGHPETTEVDDEPEDPDIAGVPEAAPGFIPSRTTVVSSAGLPRPTTTRVLTVANQKGGVGKTTTTVNLAAALAQAGLRILVIDTDPQGNASTALGVDHRAEVPSVYEVLVDSTPMAEVVQASPDVPGLFCVPATIDLAGAEIELVSLVAREQRLSRALRLFLEDLPESERFDYVFIDCPPSLGLLTVNAFVAAAEVLIPIQCEYYALEGLSQLLKNVEMIRAHLNPDLHVSTILMTMYDGRTRLSAQVAEQVREHFPDLVLDATVPRSVRISEAPSHGQTVITYDPTSSGALSYVDAADELARQALSVTTH